MKVVIEPYNPLWPKAFDEEKVIIENALHGLNIRIEHIGSTSIFGLAAKPIIDILVGIVSETDLEATVQPMKVAGYTYNKKYEPLMPYRRYFIRYQHLLNHTSPALYDVTDIDPKEQGFNAVTHVHIVLYNSEHWVRHVAFRDYLKNYADVRTEYEQLKIMLAEKDFEHKFQYSEAKSAFIAEVEQKAIQWWNKRMETKKG